MVEYILKHGSTKKLNQRANNAAQTIWAASGRAEMWRTIEMSGAETGNTQAKDKKTS